MRALVTAGLTAQALHTLEHEFGWRLTVDRTALYRVAYGGEALRDAAQIEAVVVEGDPLDAAMLAALPALRLIGCVRGGPVNVDVAAATSRGVPVLFTPGRNAEAVADFTLALILASLRHVAQVHHLVVTGALNEETAPGGAERADVVWRYRDRTRPHPYTLYKGPELRTQALGLIGFGSVGRRVAERAVALGMTVLVHDPYVPAAQITAAGCNPVSLEGLLQESDVVSLHARGSGTPLLGERELRLMKPGAYLVNTARAVLLDYDALYRLLREGRLAGAALDVFPVEPLPPDSPFLSLPNVTLTPHLAGASTNVEEHQSEILIANLRALLHGGDRSALAVQNPEVLEGWLAGGQPSPPHPLSRRQGEGVGG
jgi:phosphoglycerate dehydrogenase-like enzyme